MAFTLDYASVPKVKRWSLGQLVIACIILEFPWAFYTIFIYFDATMGHPKRPLHDFFYNGLLFVPAVCATALGAWDILANWRATRTIKNCKLSILGFFLGLMIIAYFLNIWFIDDVVNVKTPFDFF
jgi:hypothetical protein